MQRRTRIATALAALGTAMVVGAAPAAAFPVSAAPAGSVCPTAWGSLAKSRTAATTRPVQDVRTGRHSCFDRMVMDVPGVEAADLGYSVRYVDQLRQDGSGRVVPVAGGAVIEVRITAPAYDPATGAPVYPGQAGQPLPGVDLTGYHTFREAVFGGSFEGETQIGLGVRARLPFRVTRLDGHLVVDVAHRWSGTP
ncbi:hypothetical protein ACL02U_13455 [Streptomyces sp. MS06]|uniref:AMIN-like domain-containing (lipo)protein n=1 Tax=Streptomyces sp. MS06 TaxID=3385974 RepID=UPI0039A359B6